ncbi:sugar phosphate isomerase/epimerase [soil metagenome]
MRLDRVAAAPISWGVCEVPGWGVQLEPRLVLSQMSALGLRATEFGPVGFLPVQPVDKAALLASFSLRAAGGFLPVVLHEEQVDPFPIVDSYLGSCIAAGADVIVLAAASGESGYDSRPTLSDGQWARMLANLDALTEQAASRGIVVGLHPHVGTVVETRSDVQRVLDGSGVGLCLDTGHLLLGGTDPVVLAGEHADRMVHVHLKDVDCAAADRVRAGEVAFAAAVGEGLFRPLGEGDIDIAAIVAILERSGYRGWYVLEQDVMLSASDAHRPQADAAVSLGYLRNLAA